MYEYEVGLFADLSLCRF